MLQQLLTYWFIAQLLGLIGLAWARRLLPSLPDKGYAFAKPLGLLLMSYLAWLLAMLGLAPFGRGLLLACVLAIGLGGLLLLRGALPELLDWLKANWRLILFYELVFGIALAFIALRRSYDYEWVGPHPWGTERPMDYAFLNAIRVSASFPPHDPWMAGLSINYYYFGYLMMAAVSLLANLEPAVSYNLSLALIFALSAQAIAGMLINLVSATLQRGWGAREQGEWPGHEHAVHEAAAMPLASSASAASAMPAAEPLHDPEGNLSPVDMATPGDLVHAQAFQQEESLPAATSALSPKPDPQLEASSVLTNQSSPAPEAQNQKPQSAVPHGLGSYLAAILAVMLVLVAGNQGGVLQVISGTNMILALNSSDMARVLLNGLGSRATVSFDPAWTGWDFDGTSSITPTDRVEHFDWWAPSRALWGSFPDSPSRRYAITEFPFFSFWLGDMHPHVMALPFMLLAFALAMQLAFGPAPRFGEGRTGWLTLLLAGIVIGSLYMINSWDFPSYLLLASGAMLLSLMREHGSWQSIPWKHYGLQVMLVLITSLFAILPFLVTFKSLVGSKEPLIDLPVLGTLTRTIGLVIETKTQLSSFLIIFGLFFIPLLGFVMLIRSHSPFTIHHSPLKIFILIAFVLGFFLGFPLLALLPLAAYAGLLALGLAANKRMAEAFVLWAFTLVCLICFGTELIYVRDVFNSRMNTIFKFYYQAWLLWGTLGGYAIWWLMQSTWSGGAGRFSASQPWFRRMTRLLALAMFVLLLAGAMVYPWLTSSKAFSLGTWYGLKGLTPAERVPGGEAAIAWIRANTPGDAVILEAAGAPDQDGYSYNDMSAVSASTGRATVIGWTGHEGQWRAGDRAALEQIQPRRHDVVSIYSDTLDLNRTHELLNRYKVSYIYIGPMERSLYPAEGIARLTQLGEIVFQEGEVTIVRVRR